MSKSPLFVVLTNIFVICLSLLNFFTGAQCLYALNKWQHIPLKRIQRLYDFIFEFLAPMYFFVAVFSVLVALFTLITALLAFKKGVRMLNVEFHLNLFSFSFQVLVGVATGINLILFEQNLDILTYLANFWNTLELLFICQTFAAFCISAPIMVFLIYNQWQGLCQVAKDQQNHLLCDQAEKQLKCHLSNEQTAKLKGDFCLGGIQEYVSAQAELGLNYSLKPKIACLGVFLINAVLHIIFGGQFLHSGYNQFLISQQQQLYLNNVPLGAFSIAVGVFLLLSISFFIYVFTRQSYFSKLVQQIIWHLSWLIFVLNFATGVMEIGQYVITMEIYKIFQLSTSQQSSIFQAQYYLSIVDGVLTIFFGIPASVIFMQLANCRLTVVQLKEKVQIVVQSSKENGGYLPLDKAVPSRTYQIQIINFQKRVLSEANLVNMGNQKFEK